MNKANIKGDVMVKLLVGMITVSVVSTAVMNINRNSEDHVSIENLTRLMSMRAKNAFDKIGYHSKLAGFGNTQDQRPVEIIKGESSDTLVICHNDVQIAFLVENSTDGNYLMEIIDDSPRKIIEDVKSIHITQSSNNKAVVELKLIQSDSLGKSKIVSKSYSTIIDFKNLL